MLVWEDADRRVVPDPVILEPPVDEADIVAALLDFEDEYHPFGWVYDPNAGGQQMAQLLEKGEHPLQAGGRGQGITFIEHPQDNALMAMAAVRLDEALVVVGVHGAQITAGRRAALDCEPPADRTNRCSSWRRDALYVD